jgi:hypothetical protein
LFDGDATRVRQPLFLLYCRVWVRDVVIEPVVEKLERIVWQLCVVDFRPCLALF